MANTQQGGGQQGGQQGGGQKQKNVEKQRQTNASAMVSKVYQWIIAGIILVFILRNLLLRLRLYRARRRRAALKGSASTSENANGSSTSIYSNQSFFYRALDTIDAKGASPVPFLGCTWFRLIFATLICALNIAFCLVINTSLHTAPTSNSNISLYFAERTGRAATANLPILYILAGRNNLVSFFTGFSYQEVKYYHKLIGVLVLIEVVIHTFAYIGYYMVSVGKAKLVKEASEFYFHLGIVATVAGLMMGATAISAFRRRWYEIFLGIHVAGAAIFLAGTLYHRPKFTKLYVWATVAFWSFEHACRLATHLVGILHRRVFLRLPILQAEARVYSGAILLTIPFPHGKWEAGQHVYISFWGINFLSNPLLYGQSHPFSIVKIQSAENENELHFVLRVHNGLTKSLANKLGKISGNTGKSTKIAVSLEGPYGSAPSTDSFESILLIAGGSGITHITSILEDVVEKVKAGTSAVTSLHLIWAIHHLEQAQWIGTALEDARIIADAVNLRLQMDLYVTRSGTSSADTSKQPSRSTTPDVETPSIDEKGSFDTEKPSEVLGSRALVHHGRPDLVDIIQRTVAESSGCTFAVACGPESMGVTLRETASKFLSSSLQAQIASFEN